MAQDRICRGRLPRPPRMRTFRPFGWLWLALAAMAMHAVLALLDSRWLWLPDLILAGTAFYFSVKWQFWRSLKIRLLAVLHLAFLWLGIAAALYAAQGLATFIGATPILCGPKARCRWRVCRLPIPPNCRA